MGTTQFSSALVSQLCEAAWVAKKQYDLFSWVNSRLSASVTEIGFTPTDNYGSGPDYPAWKHGYWLAGEARRILRIAPDTPIQCMRKLIEDTLEIPLIQTEFQDSVAGATIANGPVRGIAVNTKGDNRNVWVRRMTLAHELGIFFMIPMKDWRSFKWINTPIFKKTLVL